MADPIRVIRLSGVSALRSQTMFHAVGHAFGPNTPDTIMLIEPDEPYVSIGFHQDAEKDVDLAYCEGENLQVLRREIGGGTVYLDGDQVFCQWIFREGALVGTLDKKFEKYISILVDTYKHFSVDAVYRPINDIHVNGRKIGGTGAAKMGKSEVLVGSIMFDFDIDTMAKVLKAPSEKFRDKVFQSLQEYMTTMKKELGDVPPKGEVLDRYLEHCSHRLERELVEGEMSEEELKLIEELDSKFSSSEWLHSAGGLRRPGVKIHEDVRVTEGTHKAPGGLIRVTAQIHGDRILDISITGDFTMAPATAVSAFEQQLRGTEVTEVSVGREVDQFYDAFHVDTPGVGRDDWVQAIVSSTTKPT